MLRAKMSSAALMHVAWLVMSQCNVWRLLLARYGIIQSAKLSFSGMTGGKAWTSEKLTRFLRLDKMRARTAREVIGECRRVNLRRGVLVDSVANADRPLEVMPLMWESVRVSSGGRVRSVASSKLLGGRLQR
jgi:hypothetical protein